MKDKNNLIIISIIWISCGAATILTKDNYIVGAIIGTVLFLMFSERD